MTHNVREDSSFADHVPFFAGLQVFDAKGKEGKANTAVIDKLVEAGALLARGRMTHSYPHSWRSARRSSTATRRSGSWPSTTGSTTAWTSTAAPSASGR